MHARIVWFSQINYLDPITRLLWLVPSTASIQEEPCYSFCTTPPSKVFLLLATYTTLVLTCCCELFLRIIWNTCLIWSTGVTTLCLLKDLSISLQYPITSKQYKPIAYIMHWFHFSSLVNKNPINYGANNRETFSWRNNVQIFMINHIVLCFLGL